MDGNQYSVTLVEKGATTGLYNKIFGSEVWERDAGDGIYACITLFYCAFPHTGKPQMAYS